MVSYLDDRPATRSPPHANTAHRGSRGSRGRSPLVSNQRNTKPQYIVLNSIQTSHTVNNTKPLTQNAFCSPSLTRKCLARTNRLVGRMNTKQKRAR